MNQLIVQETAASKDYSEYWGVQVLIVRTLQHTGIKVDIKDRLPIFRLWRVIQSRMVGKRGDQLLQLLNKLTELRKNGLEPPHQEGKYL